MGLDMYHFGKESREQLSTCHHDLQFLCFEAIKIMDFTVLQGHRGKEEQNELFDAGHSKVRGGYSRHNTNPSRAVDIAPWPIDWEDSGRFNLLAGIMFGIAMQNDIKIRWGGDWDGDWDFTDQTFNDLVHFELIG